MAGLCLSRECRMRVTARVRAMYGTVAARNMVSASIDARASRPRMATMGRFEVSKKRVQ